MGFLNFWRRWRRKHTTPPLCPEYAAELVARTSHQLMPSAEGRLILVRDQSTSMRRVAIPFQLSWNGFVAWLKATWPQTSVKLFGVSAQVRALPETPDVIPVSQLESLSMADFDALLSAGSALYTAFSRACETALRWRHEEDYRGPISILVFADGWPRNDSALRMRVRRQIRLVRAHAVTIRFLAFVSNTTTPAGRPVSEVMEEFVRSLGLRPGEVVLAFHDGTAGGAEAALARCFKEAAESVSDTMSNRHGSTSELEDEDD